MDKAKNIQCIKMNVKDMVKDDIKKELYFVDNISEAEDNAIIWQQMRLEHFRSFLISQSLSFKELATYEAVDERKVTYYKEKELKEETNEDKKKLLEHLYEDFEKIAYVSCWYYFESLSNTIFKEYAGDNGIAIGTTVGQLRKAIEDNNNNKDSMVFPEELYYGIIGYINDCYKDVVKKEEAIAPIFLKSKSHKNDTEFRLVYLKDSLWNSGTNGLKLPKEIDDRACVNVGDVCKFVNYIAVKKDAVLFEDVLQRRGLRPIKIEDDRKKIDNFDMYKLERI